jgi:glutaredoxin
MYLIIGRENCPYCKLAQNHLESRKVPYIYKDITDVVWKELLVKDIEAKTVPQIFRLVGGYDELLEVVW